MTCTTSENKSLMLRERKIKQSKKTNSKIREIFAVQYIVVEYLYPNLFTVYKLVNVFDNI